MDNIDNLIDEISKKVHLNMKPYRWNSYDSNKLKLKNFSKQAKKIVLDFITEQYDLETVKKVQDFFSTFPDISIDYDEKNPKDYIAYFDSFQKKIYVTKKYFFSCNNNIHLIATIIHEYSHAFSFCISKNLENGNIDEAFAELFSEICINYYLKTSSSIDEKEKKEFIENRKSSYPEQENFLKTFLFILKKQGKDMEIIKEYLFGSKEKFIDICSNSLGQEFISILDDLEKAYWDTKFDNYLDIKFDEYLSEEKEKLLDILIKKFPNLLDSECIKNKSEYLYNVKTPLLQKAYYIAKFPNKYFYHVSRVFKHVKKFFLKLLLFDEDGYFFEEIHGLAEPIDDDNDFKTNIKVEKSPTPDSTHSKNSNTDSLKEKPNISEHNL